MSIPREHRLRKHAEFEVVYRSGLRHFSKVLTGFYLLRSETSEAEGTSPGSSREPRIGITVGRAMGKSVVRNRIKRRMRAAITQNLGRLTRPLDVVINPKKVALEIDFQQLCAEVARAFDVMERGTGSGTDKNSAPSQSQLESPERLAARKP